MEFALKNIWKEVAEHDFVFGHGFKARFPVEVSTRKLAFGTPKFYIAPYDKINHGLV